MTEPLSAVEWYPPMDAEEWSDMREYHQPGDDAQCVDCSAGGSQCVAMLLAEFDRLKAELDRREANPPRHEDQSPVPHLATFADVRGRVTGIREHDGVSCCEWATDGPCPWSKQGIAVGLCGPRSAEDLC